MHVTFFAVLFDTIVYKTEFYLRFVTHQAEKFLQLHAQFEELGFQRDKIHDALVSTDLEHDKALDILTA